MIIRGTTPYHSFGLPVRADKVAQVWITYMQNGHIVLDKTLDDDIVIINTEDLLDNASMHCDPNDSSYAILHLTQEDTLSFTFWPAAEKNIIAVQVRVLDVDDESYVSYPFHERLMGVEKEGVIQ